VKYDHKHPNKTDAEVREDIIKVLGCTSDTNITGLNVSVQDGIVTLSGSVDAYWKIARIEDLASSVDGVLDIRNNIRVSPADTSPDLTIRKDIISALERMEVKGLENLDVKVKDGIVTISGSVPTWDTAFDVEDTARFTFGVVDVKNRLAVD
jgi:osmotically-inducible protein OsmY